MSKANGIKHLASELRDKVRNNSFVKSVMTLSAGVLVSQVITFVSLPFISRIYGPGILGDYSFLVSNAAILGVLVCLGLMSAIMIPKEDNEAKGLCRLTVLAVILLSTLLLAVALLLSGTLQLFTVNLNYKVACLLLWLYIVLTNISAVCYAYTNRLKLYKVLFWNPVIGVCADLAVSILLGLLGCGLWGYLFGKLLSALLTTLYMLRYANPFSGKTDDSYSMLNLLRKHKKFPLYQCPANIVDTLAQQLPVQLVKRLFGSAILGSYSMCMGILGIPVRFLSSPVNRVYYQEAASRYNAGEPIGEFSYKILTANIKTAIIPIALLMIFGEPLFVFFLGAQWEQAGSFAAILGLYQLVVFCSTCLSGNFVIIGKQKLNLFFSVLGIVLNLLAFGIGFFAFGNVYHVLVLFALAGTLYKLADIGLFLYYTGIRFGRFLRFVLFYIACPVAASLLVRFGLTKLGIL